MPAWEAGPLVAHDRAPRGESRCRALGPLIEGQTATNGLAFGALRPFYSSVVDPDGDRRRQDLLWPVGHIADTGPEREWRFLLGYGVDWDRADPGSRYRFWLVPLLFAGRDRSGEPYRAVFPLGGRIHEFLGRDRIAFVLWPVYAHAVTKDLESHHVLWPLVSWSRGDTEHGWRAFPFYGEFVNEGRHSKRFVLWPFWTSSTYDYPSEKGSGYILFPLYGRVQTDRQEGWMVLPPFFRWSRSAEMFQANLPWPFVRIARGETLRQTSIWPLWGTREDRHVHKTYVLWPIARQDRLERADGEYRQGRVLPFLYWDSLRAPTQSVATAAGTNAPAAAPELRSRYFKLWPLFSYRREGAERRFAALALWPLKHTAAIERNWAPWWTLYRRERGADGAGEDELLWGLWRRRSAADGSRQAALWPVWSAAHAGGTNDWRRWSLLGGLLGVERTELKMQVRALYFLRWQSEAGPAPHDAGDLAAMRTPDT